MKIQPRTEQELRDSRLMPKGIYDFEILGAEEKTSKRSAQPMIELKLKVTGSGNVSKVVKDYLVEKRGEKLRHAVEACGLLDKYNNGSIADTDFVTKRGKLQLGIERDKTLTYPDKNVVVDYIVKGTEGKGLSAYFR